MFFFSIGMLMMTLNPCILTFPSDRAVFLREENARLYKVFPYFIGKFMVDLIPTIFFPVISSLVAYWMVGMNSENSDKVLFFIFISILQSCNGLGLGYFGGTSFSDAKIAISIAPMLTMPFMLFAGFYKNSSDYSNWIGWI